MKDIAIIGFSGRFPGAKSVDEFWSNLCDGKESVQFFTSQELVHHGIPKEIVDLPNYVKASPMLENIDLFDAAFFNYTPGHANVLDPQHRFLLECAWEALEVAGYASNIKSQNIGCFIGSGGIVTSYLSEYFLVNPSLRGMTGSFEHLGNDKDFVPTRVSYNLNLTGPSMAIQTACSTSLITVHQACQSLLNNECEMAFAGAVNIRIPHQSGYIRQRGDIYSEDGHTKAFDASATGIVFGSGCGLVLLKPLEKAEADGDTIYAVIKGSAINNDGAEKLSYTASSFEGQIECISRAFKNTNISPETLRYVEAHGTGTVMGDPVEVSALTKVFQGAPWKPGTCGLGSVKSNVGHLDTVAGIASLIKAIMILNHRKLPPQINITKLNPKIDFANSPFYVNTQLEEIEKSNAPLRIGVNSLGIGGTNAFLILEEAPKNQKGERVNSAPLLLNLSARTKEGLDALIQLFREKTKATSDASIGDICYTCNTGRGQFEHRLSILAESITDLKKHLKDPEKHISHLVKGGEVNLAIQMDDISEVGRNLLEKSLKEIPAFTSIYHKIYDASKDHLFSLNAAHLSLWITFGVKPKIINVSLMQLPVAAYILGYLKLSDALMLFKAPHGDLYIKVLKDNLELGSYKTELHLIPNGIDLVELKSIESFAKIATIHSNSFDEYCKDEEISELLVLDHISNFSSVLSRTLALPSEEIAIKNHMLKQLQRYYKIGGTIDWSVWYEGENLHKIPLPTYPFQRSHHWIPRNRRLHLQDSIFCWNTIDIKVPSLEEDVYEITLSLPEYPVLHDHYFCGSAMVAGSALMSWIIEVASQHYHIDQACIEDFSFSQALMVPDEGKIEVQLVVTEAGEDRFKFSVRSYHHAFLMKSEMWVEHASGYFAPSPKALKPVDFDPKSFSEGAVLLSQDEIYSRMEKRGLELTTAYRCIGSMKIKNSEALASLDIQHLHTNAFYGKYHPGILDALFQTVQCLLPSEIREDRVFLLSQWKNVTFYKECLSPRYIHAKIVDFQGRQQFTADVALLNDQMELIASVERVTIQRGTRDVARAMEMNHYQNWQYSLDWMPIPEEIDPTKQVKGKVLIYADDGGIAEKIRPLIEKDGVAVQLVKFNESHPDTADVNAVIFMWGLDSERSLNAEEINQQVNKVSASLLDIAKKFYDTSVPIYIVTQGGVGAQAKESHLNPLQGTLWGMGRTLSVERGKGPCYIIDLDPDILAATQVGALSKILLQQLKDEQIALRGNEILVPRLSHYQKPTLKRLNIDFEKQFKVEFKPDHMPLPWAISAENLDLPKENEVLVKLTHAGISYRDYLQTTGALGGESSHIGDDFSGTVQACGSGVKEFQVGDHVIGLYSGTLTSHVIVKKEMIAKISPEVDADQAAAWPLVYVTASYGLNQLAKLKEGQTVLIPSASSGVGYAAVQIAKALKTNIIATVNGSEKVFLLNQQGLFNVVDTSRTHWKEKLEELLEKHEVDCILSGTHKEITEVAAKRLSLKGSIVDLSGGRLAFSDAIKKHAGFFPVHMYEVIKKQPEWISKTLNELAAYLQSKSKEPMLIQEYSIAQLPEAIQQLSNPNRLKKIILKHTEPEEVLFKPNATYVVIGGLGALGRILIPWLIENGVKSICILDILEQDATLNDLLKSQYGEEFLRKFNDKYGKNFLFDVKKKYGKDTVISYYKCDVNAEENVKEIFSSISSQMLPVKGILHCATMLFDAAIPKQTLENFYKILSVKTTGSINLHLNTLHLDLDYFVMFSSIASLMGSPNQFNYSAANSFQDTLSHHRSKLGLNTLAINWSPWKVGVGAYMGQSAQKVWESWGSYMLDPAKDLNSLRYLLKFPIPQVALFAIDWKKFTGQFEKVPGYLIHLSNEAKMADVAQQKENVFLLQFVELSESEARAKMLDFLKEEISSCLQLDKEKIEPEQNFSILGIDSLMSISVRDHLQKKVGKELPATIMFNYPTLNGLCGFIIDTFVEFNKAPSEKPAEAKPEEMAEELSDEDVKGFLEGIDLDEGTKK